ncbi:MAG: class I SAM-dependent methyltransferase [Planctomycetes bacterium]|nr:class I SAM-dependent methyltransferase [Planctomycetota bacterium]
MTDGAIHRVPEQSLSDAEREQREYYNGIADTYDRHFHNPHAMRYRNMVYDGFFKSVDLRGKDVLDACCGGGENSSYLVARGAVVTGLDISERQCEIYHRRFPEHRVECCSILQTTFGDATFDIIVTESLHHLPPNLDRGVRELHRILKPGGMLVFWEPSAGSIFDALRKVWYRFDRMYFESNERSIDARAFTKQYEDLFSLESLRYGGNLAHLFVQSSMILRIPVRLVRWYAPMFLVLERWLGRLQGRMTACWVLCVLRKQGAPAREYPDS